MKVLPLSLVRYFFMSIQEKVYIGYSFKKIYQYTYRQTLIDVFATFKQ